LNAYENKVLDDAVDGENLSIQPENNFGVTIFFSNKISVPYPGGLVLGTA
jgi:hypothetical protein